MADNYNYNETGISDLEFSKRFLAAYRKEMESFNPDDWTIDQAQLQKLHDLIEFFKKAAKDLGGKIDSIDIDPAAPPNGITANFLVFDLFGDEVQQFCDVVRHCSAISMDVTVDDEISISCTVPNIFVRK